ncbi:MAG: PQQ-binding-like beta-propeller repeat protein [Planctomycetes bacterium]|nr:PQQ-binding-like beta-propeller repeat protein [Planctomycetota bacterium]
MLKRQEDEHAGKVTEEKRLRLLPGIVIVILQWVIRFVVPAFVPEAAVIGVFGGLLGGLAIMIWWAFFSRASRTDRWGAIAAMILIMLATSRFLHVSIATGMMGMVFAIYGVPGLSLAFVIWAVASRRLSSTLRRVTLVAALLFACSMWTLVKTGGFDTDGNHDFSWRWAQTPEQRLLAESSNEPIALSAPADARTGADWPAFRGLNRDSIVRGVRIKTDWSASPPIELWRRSVGPGWSSMAVSGNLFYTQEQRGDDEVVACYRVMSGEPVWKHADPTRFWESNGGAGPRGTPTLSGRRVITFGGTGILNALDADDGSVVWSRNAASDAKIKVPHWGFSSSPLVVDDVVIIAAAGKLAAYDLATGDLRWLGPDGEDGYSSPHLVTLDGVTQVLLMSKAGAVSVVPADGTLLWEYPWPGGSRIVQPAQLANGDLLLNAGEGKGTRRVAVAQDPNGWAIEERWKSTRLKLNFNDVVVHKGHAFGFVGTRLICIDLEDGQRKWRGARYGGQMLLLADQALLLVLSEKGELALVAADPDQFTELARFAAIEGKTWNHPVLVDDILLVRNAQEIAAFRLSLAGSTQPLHD